jgi:hypothetical protein
MEWCNPAVALNGTPARCAATRKALTGAGAGVAAAAEQRQRAAMAAFHAALCCTEDDLDEVLGLLIGAMGHCGDDTRGVLLAAVQHVSGEERRFTPEEWADWWQRRRRALAGSGASAGGAR